LLRLHLPLNVKVYSSLFKKLNKIFIFSNSQDFTAKFIGRCDGRCVQRAGMYSMQDDDLRLLGIPR